MERQKISLFKTFEDIRQEKDGIEFWYARDLQQVLWYSQWRNFENIISRAIESTKSSQISHEEHFANLSKTQKSRNQYGETTLNVKDFILTRYACYLIAINGDTSKPQVAFAQKYFLTKARSYEVFEQKISEMERLTEREKQTYTEKEFHRLAFDRWVDGKWIAKIISKGDMILFGGNSTAQMKEKYQIPEKRPLADFLPAVLINAKGLATGITNINMENKNLEWEKEIANEHMQNNREIRELLKRRWITPENLPPEEDIKKVERRHKKEQKELQKNSTKKLK